MRFLVANPSSMKVQDCVGISFEKFEELGQDGKAPIKNQRCQFRNTKYIMCMIKQKKANQG